MVVGGGERTETLYIFCRSPSVDKLHDLFYLFLLIIPRELI